MQILLASAKIMRDGHAVAGLPIDAPRFQDVAEAIAEELGMKTSDQIAELFRCSPEIGALNKNRYALFGTEEAEITPALFAYYGQAYKHLKADELIAGDVLWANSHLWISTCMFGLLRPLDGINQYRMEGGFALRATGGMKVEDFWKSRLTDVLIDSVLDDDGILVYLDTEEFRRLFDWKRVEAEIPTIIEPRFQVLKNGKLSTPSVWAKTCRGAMARYIIQNRISDACELMGFEYEGFRYTHSENCSWLFVRDNEMHYLLLSRLE